MNTLQHSITLLPMCNKALWLDATSHMTILANYLMWLCKSFVIGCYALVCKADFPKGFATSAESCLGPTRLSFLGNSKISIRAKWQNIYSDYYCSQYYRARGYTIRIYNSRVIPDWKISFWSCKLQPWSIYKIVPWWQLCPDCDGKNGLEWQVNFILLSLRWQTDLRGWFFTLSKKFLVQKSGHKITFLKRKLRTNFRQDLWERWQWLRLPVWPDLAKFRHFGKNL